MTADTVSASVDIGGAVEGKTTSGEGVTTLGTVSEVAEGGATLGAVAEGGTALGAVAGVTTLGTVSEVAEGGATLRAVVESGASLGAVAGGCATFGTITVVVAGSPMPFFFSTIHAAD
jgi:hypothetical protein